MKVNRVSDFSESQAKLDDVEASFGAGISCGTVQHPSEQSEKELLFHRLYVLNNANSLMPMRRVMDTD